ncbi:TonB-dependent receptor [Sphingomonas sp. MG17]|uniref:TonB-dependent receptor n=1 Tax=Sphingomonas tagetis TaxID=2949092 RepID=A0A9X2HNN5_9SPHN|nr:TonB-dependent receptor [Sphingomonas tagetis]MCP3730683.1 TonB-dependent receptor [Sphingomonas tagetis]
MKQQLLGACGLTALMIVGASPAFAQDDTSAQDEIVVTAQGRAEVLSDVPIAVSAVNAEALERTGASDIRQLNQVAPSLLVSSTGSEANGSARIRGIGTVGDNPGLESSVATFVDGVYRSRSGIGLNELGDIERIEVLRGPQGTLFGRNASAGLINIVSKSPSFTFGGKAEASYGNYDYWRGQLGITGPLTETIAARLDGVYVKRDGFYRNVDAAGNVIDRINDRNRYFIRGQLLFEPNSDLSVRLIGDYTSREETCCAAVYTGLAETFDPTPGVPGDYSTAASNRVVDVMTSLGWRNPGAGDPYSRRVATNADRPYDGKTTDWGVSGQLDYSFGDVKLTSITAYRDYKSSAGGDLDYGNVDILYRAADGNSFRRFRTFTQELRLQGAAFDERLDWLIGGYYAKEKLDVRDNLKFGAQYGAFLSCRLVATVSPNALLRNPAAPGCLATTPNPLLGGATGRQAFAAGLGAAAPVFLAGLDRLSTVSNVGDNNANYFQTSSNFAVFTHNIIKFTDQLSLTLGGRYTSESKDFSATFNNTNTACPTQRAFFSPFLAGGATPLPASILPLATGLVNATCQGNSSSSLNGLNLTDSRDEDEWTGTAVLSFKPTEQLMIYASYSKGYKAGGFNLDRSALGLPQYAENDPRNIGGRGAAFGTANLQFDAEKVNAYELGLKFNGRRFNLNVAAFRQDFSDFQLNTFNGSVFLVQNITGCDSDLGLTDQDPSAATGACPAGDISPGVRSQGFELEASFYPSSDIAVMAGYTYAQTKYADDLAGRNTGSPLDPALFLLPGQLMSNAPEHVVTTSFAWTPSLGSSGLSGLIYVDQRTTSDYNTGSDLFPEKQQDGYTVVNARVGIRGRDEKWAIEFWAQNLLNQNYQQVAFNSAFQGANSRAQVTAPGFGAPSFLTANQLFSSYLAEPRTYGITGRFKF